MKCLWLLPALVVAGFAQTETAVSREGSYWVQTLSGTASAPSSGRLRVSSRDAIAFEGQAVNEIQYTLKRRVKASDEPEARRYLREFTVKAERQGEWTALMVTAPRGSCELRVKAPRQLRQVVLTSEGGGIEAYDLDGELTVQTGGGNVEVDRIQGGVTARSGGGTIRVGTVGGGVRCVTGGGSIHADSVGGAGAFETAGGEILVKQVSGPVRTSTGGGSIRVERASSSVNASTLAGLIEVVQAGGQVTAATSGGAIKIGSAKGVQAESAAGAIRLSGTAGPLRAVTAVGSIFAQLTKGSLMGDSSLTSASGDITVLIPSNLAVTIQAVNQSPGGRIVSDFSQIRTVLDEQRRMRAPVRADGALNGGGPVLRLSTARGTIFLRRE